MLDLDSGRTSSNVVSCGWLPRDKGAKCHSGHRFFEFSSVLVLFAGFWKLQLLFGLFAKRCAVLSSVDPSTIVMSGGRRWRAIGSAA
jgi:hypothetical protein